MRLISIRREFSGPPRRSQRALRQDECGKLVRRFGETELRAIEPRASAVAALHSPATAIVDFGEVARAIAAEATAAGATINTGVEVCRILGAGREARVELAGGALIRADRANRLRWALRPIASRAHRVSPRSPGSCRSGASAGSCDPNGVISFVG